MKSSILLIYKICLIFTLNLIVSCNWYCIALSSNVSFCGRQDQKWFIVLYQELFFLLWNGTYTLDVINTDYIQRRVQDFPRGSFGTKLNVFSCPTKQWRSHKLVPWFFVRLFGSPVVDVDWKPPTHHDHTLGIIHFTRYTCTGIMVNRNVMFTVW